MSNAAASSGTAETDAFLQAHPEVRVGRDALRKAEEEFGDDTFAIVNKPLGNVVLVQHFNPDTLERLFAVALVDDDKAEKSYKEQNDDDDDGDDDEKSCAGCGAGSGRACVDGPARFLYERMVTCSEACPKAQVGRMWPA